MSIDHSTLTFMGYLAPVDAIDVSNANTPGVVDPTNPVNETVYRVVAELDQHGHFRFTKTNAYSGNNGRAAIMNGQSSSPLVYTAGNAGNGANPQPNGVIIGAGAQILTFANTPLVAQSPEDPTPVGSFNVTQLGLPGGKIGKDTNFRGLTIFNNVIYMTKGSGSKASTPSISSTRAASMPTNSHSPVQMASAFRQPRRRCPPHRSLTPPACCRPRASSLTTCAS